MPSKILLRLKGTPGLTETAYHSSVRTRTYSGSSLTRERQEAVDFTVQTRVQASNEKTITAQVETVSKDGTTDLHDLAFPELKETIPYILSPLGKVIKAGGYSESSIYFVPSLPLPEHAVSVGDTWVLEHQWLSSREQVPFQLSIVGILKQILPCESKGFCADIEISGHVKIGLPANAAASRFTSRLWGHVLFSLERGDVLWSEMHSEEEMSSDLEKTKVDSCMVSVMKIASTVKLIKLEKLKPQCDPAAKAVGAIPSL